jgi:hypothetical protein
MYCRLNLYCCSLLCPRLLPFETFDCVLWNTNDNLEACAGHKACYLLVGSTLTSTGVQYCTGAREILPVCGIAQQLQHEELNNAILFSTHEQLMFVPLMIWLCR